MTFLDRIEELESIRLEARQKAFDRGDFSGALTTFGNWLNLFFESENIPQQYRAETLVDMAYPLRRSNRDEDAVRLLEEAETFQGDSNYIRAIIAEERAVMVNYHFGDSNDSFGDARNTLQSIDEALMNYELAQTRNDEIRGAKEINERIKRATGIKSVVYGNLANLVEDEDLKAIYFDKSEALALEEIRLRENDNDKGQGIVNAYHTLAVNYTSSGRFDEAEQMYKKAQLASDETTKKTATFLNYRLAVNSFLRSGGHNEQTDEHISRLVEGKDELDPALIKYTQGVPGWNSLEEMTSPELKPMVKKFYSTPDK